MTVAVVYSRPGSRSDDLPGQQRLFDEPQALVMSASNYSDTSAAAQASAEEFRREEIAAVIGPRFSKMSLSFGRQLPQQRRVSSSYRGQAAAILSAEQNAVGMYTLLWNADEPAVKVFRRAVAAIQRHKEDPQYTLPHPEPGYRLIDQDKIVEFEEVLWRLAEDLKQAAQALTAELPNIIARRRDQRGKAFSEEDYRFDTTGLSEVVVRYYPNGLPDYLLTVAPSIAEREMAAIKAEFTEAIRLKEVAMAEAMFDAVAHLLSRLRAESEDGKPKAFRASTVNAVFDGLAAADLLLSSFGIGGGELKGAFDKIREVVSGQGQTTMTQRIRDDQQFRQELAGKLEEVNQTLLSLSVIAPRRNLLMKRQAEPANG